MAANKIKGLTLQIGGDTTELTRALSGVNKTTKSLQSELREVDKLLKVDPTNTELLAQKQKLLADSVGATSDKLRTLKTAAEQAQEQLNKGEISEEQFRALQREVIKTENELGKLEKKAKDTGDKFDYLGTKAEKMNGFMKNAALGVAGVGAGLVGMAVKAGQSADDINTLAKQTGLTTAEIQKFQYASDIIDVSLDTLTGSMAKLTKNMSTAKDGTGAVSEAFTTLGVRIKDDVTGELRNNQDVFNDTITALGNVTNETERDALAMEIFGKSAQDLNPLILGGADALTKLGQEAEDAGLILSQDALDGANAFNDGIDELKAKSTAAFSKIGGDIAENLLPAISSILEAVSELVDWILNNKNAILSTLAAIVAGLAAFNVVVIIQNLVKAFKAWQIATEGMTIAQQLLNLAMSLNPIALIISLIAALVAGIVILWNTNEDFRNAIIGIWENIKGAGENLWGWLVNFFTVDIPNAIASAISWFSQLPQKVGEFFSELPGKIGTALGLALGTIAKWGVDTFNWVVEEVPKLIENIISFYMQLPGRLLEIFNMVITNLLKWISDMSIKVKTEIPKIISSITGFFEALPSKMLEIGGNIVTGLWEGIKNSASWLLDSISGFASGIIDGFKDAFDINSPSKILKDEVGKMLGLGISEGLYDSIIDVSSAMDALNSEINIGSTGTSRTTNNRTTNNTSNSNIIVNMYNTVRNDNDIKKISTGLNKTLTNYNRAIGVNV